VLGVDTSKEVITSARERYPHISFIRCDVLATPVVLLEAVGRLIEEVHSNSNNKGDSNKGGDSSSSSSNSGVGGGERKNKGGDDNSNNNDDTAHTHTSPTANTAYTAHTHTHTAPQLVCFVDIGGNRELEALAALLPWVASALHPRLIVVKSQSLYNLTQTLAETETETETDRDEHAEIDTDAHTDTDANTDIDTAHTHTAHTHTDTHTAHTAYTHTHTDTAHTAHTHTHTDTDTEHTAHTHTAHTSHIKHYPIGRKCWEGVLATAEAAVRERRTTDEGHTHMHTTKTIDITEDVYTGMSYTHIHMYIYGYIDR
jgi:hypothetical protein